MATISASTTLDAAARTAGEAFTIQNGAIFTIDTHTRFHANAPASATGSLGSFTMTAASGGECFIDGQSVRMVAYSGGTGNVPAYNTSITQGGVTGVFLCAMSALNVAPTAVGAAMPATGFIMFKSVSNGPFVAGALSGIGATVVGSEFPGFLEIVMDDGATFTIGRAQKFTTRMQWFTPINTSGVAITTSGARHQQIQLPNFGGTNCFYPGVWIEDGVGSDRYEFWPACFAGTGSPWATTALGSDARSKFVQCLAGGIIRIGGDGTNSIGDLPVSGCKIRIPNIICKSAATASRASDSVPNSTLATRPDFTTTNAGQIDIEGMIGHWQINLSQAYSVKLFYVALFDQFTISECATWLELYDGGNGNYTIAGDVPAMVLTSNFAGGYIASWKGGRSGTIASADYGWNVQYCNDIVFSNCHFQNRTFRTNAGGHPYYASYCNGLIFDSCVVVGCSVYFNVCAKTIINHLYYADSFHTTSSATTPPVGVVQLFYTSDTIMTGFGWYTSVANIHPDTAILYLSYAVGVKVRSMGIPASKLSAGSSNAMLYFCNDAGNSQNLEFKRIYFDLIATTFYNAVNSSKNVSIENCEGNVTSQKTLVSAALNQQIWNSGFSSIAPASTASIYGSIFYHHFTSSTAGRLGLIFNEPTAEFVDYVTTNFTTSATGTSGFNSSQGLALINSGDYAIFEFPRWIKGIDSFQNSAPTITTATNMLVEYQIDTGSGWNGTWKTFNAANLSAEVVDEVAGFKFQIKVSATATSASNILTVCYCLTNSNSTAQAIQYPLDTRTVTFYGYPEGCDIVIFDGNTDALLASADQVDTDTYDYVYELLDGPASSIHAGFIKPGFIPYYIRWIELQENDFSIPVTLVMDRNYEGYVEGGGGTPA